MIEGFSGENKWTHLTLPGLMSILEYYTRFCLIVGYRYWSLWTL